MAGMPAYKYERSYSNPSYAPQRAPRISVVPGTGGRADQEALSPAVLFAAKALAVVLVVFAVLGFVRVGLASATVTTALSVDEISSQIEVSRSAGNELEVTQSYLSNPSHVKVAATELGMKEASESLTVHLPKDVVTTDAQGNLSLSSSIQAATEG